MSYTRYCLSTSMLATLARLKLNGTGFVPGPTRSALMRRELIKPLLIGGNYRHNAELTPTGAWALEQAREEGWIDHHNGVHSHEIP